MSQRYGTQVQQRVKLCVKRDLTEHDIVSRIMRKENYLIGAQPPYCRYHVSSSWSH